MTRTVDQWMTPVLAGGGTVARPPAATKRPPAVQYVDLTPLQSTLPEAQREAFRVALGTIAPSQWIALSALKVALESLRSYRHDAINEQPDLVVSEIDHVLLIQVKRRVRDAAAEMLAKASLLEPSSWVDARVQGAVSEQTEAGPPSASSQAAHELRELSGLSARQLGEIFPVARESFQRWVSGDLSPSAENLQRLMALRHFLRALADRVPDARAWLLTPLPGTQGNETPLDRLARGDMAQLWRAIADFPSRSSPEAVIDAEGDRGVVVRSSLRGTDAPTPEDELDGYDEWFDDD